MEAKTATQMATIYGMKSSVAFNKMLVKCGLLIHTSKGYQLSVPMRGWGFTTVIEVPYFLPNGIRTTKKRAAWTESGQQFIHKRLGRIGIMPVNERNDIFTILN